MKVTKDGFEFFTQDFSIEGESQSVSAQANTASRERVVMAEVSKEACTTTALCGVGAISGGTLQICGRWERRLLCHRHHPCRMHPSKSWKSTLYICRIELKAVTLTRKMTRLVGLSSLKALNLSGNPITDQGLKYISTISSLKNITLGNTEISDACAQNISFVTKSRILEITRARTTLQF